MGNSQSQHLTPLCNSYMKTQIQMKYQRTLKSIPFYESVNLHQYITYNNPQTTRNWTTSNQISEVDILGSQVEFTRLGKTYTTNLINKHRLTYPTNYTSYYSYVQQRKKSATILKRVGNSEIQFPLSYMWTNMMPLSGTSSIPSFTFMLIHLVFFFQLTKYMSQVKRTRIPGCCGSQQE